MTSPAGARGPGAPVPAPNPGCLLHWQPLQVSLCAVRPAKAVCPHCPQVHVDLKHLCMHLARWRLLNKEFNLPDLAVMVLFAKQQAPHVEDFTLQPHPLWLDYK